MKRKIVKEREIGHLEAEETGTDIRALATRISDDLRIGPVALGFECPLFVPLHSDATSVLSCRPGEKNRAWSASAGVSSMGAGLVESAWLLAQVSEQLLQTVPVFVRVEDIRLAERGLLVWEAFVTGNRTTTHEQDALAAAMEFRRGWPNLRDALPCEGTDIMSLIGMALLRSGWSKDIALLSKKPIVVNPNG